MDAFTACRCHSSFELLPECNFHIMIERSALEKSWNTENAGNCYAKVSPHLAFCYEYENSCAKYHTSQIQYRAHIHPVFVTDACWRELHEQHILGMLLCRTPSTIPVIRLPSTAENIPYVYWKPKHIIYTIRCALVRVGISCKQMNVCVVKVLGFLKSPPMKCGSRSVSSWTQVTRMGNRRIDKSTKRAVTTVGHLFVITVKYAVYRYDSQMTYTDNIEYRAIAWFNKNVAKDESIPTAQWEWWNSSFCLMPMRWIENPATLIDEFT